MINAGVQHNTERVPHYSECNGDYWWRAATAAWTLSQLKDLCAYARPFDKNKNALPSTKSELHRRWMSTWHASADLRAELQAKTAAAVAADAGALAETEDAPAPAEQADIPEAEVVPAAENEIPAEIQAAQAAYVGPLMPAEHDSSRSTDHLVTVGDDMLDADQILQLAAIQEEEARKKSYDKMFKVYQTMKKQTKNASLEELQILKDLCFSTNSDAAQ
jgi:hypothetical protein